MGCNCNKRTAAAQPRRYDTTAKASGTTGSATQAFSLILRDGTTQTFGSRLEADAANARAGYTGIVRQNGR